MRKVLLDLCVDRVEFSLEVQLRSCGIGSLFEGSISGNKELEGDEKAAKYHYANGVYFTLQPQHR